MWFTFFAQQIRVSFAFFTTDNNVECLVTTISKMMGIIPSEAPWKVSIDGSSSRIPLPRTVTHTNKHFLNPTVLWKIK